MFAQSSTKANLDEIEDLSQHLTDLWHKNNFVQFFASKEFFYFVLTRLDCKSIDELSFTCKALSILQKYRNVQQDFVSPDYLELELVEYLSYLGQQQPEFSNHFISDTFIKNVISRLDYQALKALQRTCQAISNTLNQLVPALELWEEIINNHSRVTIDLLEAHPHSMFEFIPRLDANDNYFQISPFQLTLQFFDTYVLNHFVQSITNKIDLVKKFINQSQRFLMEFDFTFKIDLPNVVYKVRDREEVRLNYILDAHDELRNCQRIAATPIVQQALDIKSWGALSTTCQHMQTFFKKPLEDAKLLDLVKKAKWQKLDTLIKHNPERMFIKYKYQVGDHYLQISPAQYAFMLYDTCIRRMLIDAINNNPDAIRLFIQQEAEIEPFDIQPLIVAYQTYETKRKLFQEKKITAPEIKKAIAELSLKQYQLLPYHLMRVMTNAALQWSYNMQLEAEELQQMLQYQCLVEKRCDYYHWHSLEDVVNQIKKGSVLQRGNADCAILFENHFCVVDVDCILIQCLWAQRQKEHNEDVRELQLMLNRHICRA